MTDADLVLLIDDRPLDEWTAAETTAVAEGVRRSATVRQAMLDQLAFEELLAKTLAAPVVSVESILARATEFPSLAPRPRPAGTALAWALGTLVAVAAGLATLPLVLRMLAPAQQLLTPAVDPLPAGQQIQPPKAVGPEPAPPPSQMLDDSSPSDRPPAGFDR
jgi:hypothetical protein